jgi:3-hydroxyacyl-[acyl-carrier-protein] dehydratase
MLADLAVPAQHPVYAGHFPGRPILPGAVLLDAALEAIAQARTLNLREWQVSAKFLQTVAPGDPLALEHTSTRESSVRFTVRSAQRLIATGTLTALSGARQTSADGL